MRSRKYLPAALSTLALIRIGRPTILTELAERAKRSLEAAARLIRRGHLWAVTRKRARVHILGTHREPILPLEHVEIIEGRKLVLLGFGPRHEEGGWFALDVGVGVRAGDMEEMPGGGVVVANSPDTSSPPGRWSTSPCGW
jgi:hypothetical protein